MANKMFYIIPNQRTTTAGIKEKGSNFTCPANTVMTGRYHKGDENVSWSAATEGRCNRH